MRLLRSAVLQTVIRDQQKKSFRQRFVQTIVEHKVDSQFQTNLSFHETICSQICLKDRQD